MPTPPRPAPLPHRLAAAALALLGPGLVLGLGLAWLLRAEERDLSPAAESMEKVLAKAEPEILVVGNSLAGRGVDPAALGAAIAEDPVRVATIWEAGTWPANWYLFLKNRVYANDHRPHAVVFCVAPETLLKTRLRNELTHRSLVNHAGEFEPLVFAKALGQETPSAWLMRLRRRRNEVQTGWAGLVRDASVGLLQEGPGEGLLARGEAAAAPALARVFEVDGAVDMALHHHVIPVVEVEREELAREDDPTVAGSFVPDLLDLAGEYGTRVVFAVMPLLGATREAAALPPLLEADLVRLLNARGAALVDLDAGNYPANLFADPAHLNVAGRERATRELAAALEALDVMGEGPFPLNRVPLALVYEARLHGSPPELGDFSLQPDPEGHPCRFLASTKQWFPLSDTALSAAGIGAVSPLVVLEDGQPLTHVLQSASLTGPCAGAYMPQSGQIWVSPGLREEPPPDQRHYRLAVHTDLPVRMGRTEGWFVYPGTTLAVDLPAWSGDPGELQVLVGLEPLMGEGDAATASIGGEPIPLAPQGRRLLAGQRTWPTPAGPWSIRVSSPAGGPWLLVRWLAVRADGETQDLIGSEALTRPPVARLVPEVRKDEATVLTEAARFPIALERFGRGSGARAALPAFDALSSDAISARVPCCRCTPLRLVEDGTLRDRPELSCTPAALGKPDKSCHEDGYFAFTSRDGTDPLTNGRRYEIALRPDRREGQRWWLYPGDHALLPFPGSERRRLRDGAGSLRLEGLAIAGEDPEGRVQVNLRVGDAIVLAETLPVRRFDEGPWDHPLEPRQEVRGAPVVLELVSEPHAPFLLLTAGELRE